MMKHFNKAKQLLLLSALLVMAAVSAVAQPLNGTYTVGGTTPSYATLTDAVNALTTNGVSGPVIFNLRNGTFSGAQYTLPSITGASATNRITFQSETGLATNVTVSYAATGTGDNFVFMLDNASYITFKNLTVTNTATSTYARAIRFASAASYDTVASCAFSSTITTSTSSSAALVYSTAFTGTNNVITNNTFTNGSFGIFLAGSSSSSYANNNVIQTNSFTNQSYRGIYNIYANATKILGNTISSNTTNEFYGINCQYSDGGIQAISNTITANNASGNSQYGIYVYYCNGNSTNYNKVKSNTISISNTSSAYVYGLYNYSSPYDTITANIINTTTMNGYGNYPYYYAYSSNGYSSGNVITSLANYYDTYLNMIDYSSPNTFFGNNTISVTGGTSGYINLSGIRSGSNNSQLYKNTINVTGRYTYGSTYAYMASDASNPIVRKNTLTITSSGGIYPYSGYYNSGATIDSNIYSLTSSYASSLYNYMGYNCSNSSIVANNNISVTSASYAYGLSCDYANGITIANNTVNSLGNGSSSYYSYGIYAQSTTNATISNNNVKSVCSGSNSYGTYGIYASSSTNIKVLSNKSSANASGYTYTYAYGMYISNVSTAKIYNNSVYAKSIYGAYGVDLSYTTNYDFRNNTVYKDANSYGFGIYAYHYNPIGTCNIVNNVIIGVGSGGYGMYGYFGQASTRPFCEYNLYYSPSNTFYDAYTGTSYSLAGWRSAFNMDKHSLLYNASAAMPNRATGDLTPSATAPEAWALNGRGIHDVANVPKDINGVNRPANKPAGVPDLGAYEITPTSIPPDCAAFPAAPATGLQYFTFGGDTVASIDWTTATVPSTVTVKHYPGEAPQSFAFPFYMYFHTDIDAGTGSFPHTTNVYYNDPQTGTTAAESGLRLVKRIGTGTWTPYSTPASSTNPVRNIISTTGLSDFGQHTGSDVANNASISRLVSPTPTFCAPSTQTIKVTLKNTGNNTLNNVKIDWSINGSPMGTVTYTTPVNTFLVQPDSVQVTLGTYTFTSARPVRLVAYSYLPNGVPDAANVDDTLKAVITPGLNGDYTVGGTPAPDFVDVKEAIDILNLWGVCGPTTFKIRDSVGAYQGAGNINAPIIGGSLVNRVTFTSQSGNAANVVVSGINNNPVFGLKNVTDVTIKNITIMPLGSTAISIEGSPKRDTIRGCFLTAPTSTTTDVIKAVVSDMSPNSYSGTYNGRDMAIIKNTFSGAANGISMCSNGNSTTTNNVIDSNTFSSHYYANIYLYYPYSEKIRGNIFNGTTYASGGYPAYVYNSYTSGTDPIEILGNTMNISGTTNQYIYNYFGYYIFGTSTTRAKFAYNKITYTNPLGNFYNYSPYSGSYLDYNNNDFNIDCSNGYGIYVYYSTFQNSNIYNNVVNTKFSSSGQGLYVYNPYGSDSRIYNNTFINSGAGYAAQYYLPSSVNLKAYNNIYANLGSSGNALYWYNGGTTNVSDYNNIFSANGQHFNYNGTVDTSLNHWRATYSTELNSISYNPGLFGLGNMRPNPADPAAWSLNGRGLQIADNNIDKDGNPRETDVTLGVPDIGAYEFEPTSVPPLAKASPALPAPGTTQVFTFGQDTVVKLTWNPMTIVSNTAEVRQYSGRKGINFPAAANNMYFYSDVVTQNVSADYNADLYYHDNWLGNIGSEANLRLLKKLNPNPWVAYNGTLSATNTTRNVITAAHVTSTGSMTGIEDGTLFSAVITPNGSATFCPGGSVQLDANVGAGYTYKWYKNGIEIPGATNQSYVATAAGDYTVQVTDVNATPSSVTANSVSVGVAIIAPPAALIRASGPLTFCTGGDLTLMANTGTNLWYQWQFNGNNIPGANSDTFKVTGSGNYTVTVNNIGCASTSTITTINQGPLNVMLGEDTSFCESQVLVLDAGYPGAHYLWNTGDTTQKIYITNTSADYSVFVDAGTNCQARDTINVHVDPLPSVVGISYVSMGGSTFQFAPSGQLNTNSYMWMYSDGAVDFNQNTTHTFPASADWIVTLIVFNDCGTDTSTLDLRTLDVASVKNTAGINLYPNPASDKVTLSADKVKMSEITIVNNLGQVVYRGTEENVKSTTIDITGFVDGHYIIRAKGSDGKVINKPFDVLK